MSPSRNGANGFAVGGGGGGGDSKAAGGSARAPMLHIKDITTATPNVDPHLPIRKLLEAGDVHVRQAATFLTFQRPDLALKEYLQGYIIAIEIIPHHKEFSSMRSDRGGLNRLYQALQHKVLAEGSTYDDIKQVIIADNARNNTQPTNAVSRSPETALQPNGGSPAKTKPSIHPKPQALHGNSIRPGSSKGHAAIDLRDLNARFASLRGPSAAQQQQQKQEGQQDPRIRTQPIPPMGPPPPPPPRGPRQMPTKSRPGVSIDSTVPNLPKVPDAIYSPARGTVSTEAGELPSSTGRGLFSRTNSTTSFTPATTNTAPTVGMVARLQSHSNNTAGPANQSSNNLTSSSTASLRLPIPTGDEIEPQELYDLMKWNGGQILLIDMRARDSFNEGHILSQATICIEPEVLVRPNISAAEIAASNVVGPTEEETHFDRRDKFEVVVLYDQSSESIPENPTSALMALRRALVDFNYGRELRRPPKLLKGGLNAWTDFMGLNSLQSSSSPRRGPAGSQAADSRGTAAGRKRPQIIAKPVGPEDAERWQKSIQRGDQELAQSPSLARSTEEFLRRYPPIFPTPESMTSPVSPTNHSTAAAELPTSAQRLPPTYNDLPSPPTRPAPAVPRPSYSGLAQGDEGMDVSPAVKPSHPGHAQKAKRATNFTGLVNQNNVCYANSAVQALRITAGFAGELTGVSKSTTWRVPRKSNEHLDQPQLMAKIMGNLFQWMNAGDFPDMQAKTLMDYSRHVSRNPVFGDGRQHDASEYLLFLFNHLDLETNRLRDSAPAAPPVDKGKPATALEAAVETWRTHKLTSDSMIDKYFRGVEVRTVKCRCGHVIYSPGFTLVVSLTHSSRCRTLDDVLRERVRKQAQDDYRCDNCGSKNGITLTDTFARLPEVFILSLNRFNQEDRASLKNLQEITFDLDYTDFEPLFLEPGERALRPGTGGRQGKHGDRGRGEELDEGFGSQFGYQCYAVIVHKGEDLSQGHYYAYVRSDLCGPEKWYRCDDRTVTEIPRSEIRAEVFKTKSHRTPYILFFRRLQSGSGNGSSHR